MRKHKQKSRKERGVADERIAALFVEAEKAKAEPARAKRYMKLARMIAMKMKVKFTPAQKKRFCKECYAYLVPGKNCTVRLNGKTVVYTCGECKSLKRHTYKPKKAVK